MTFHLNSISFNCRYLTVSDFKLLDLSLEVRCGSTSCSGTKPITAKCIGKCQPIKGWSLCGFLKVIEPKISQKIKFESAKMAKYFVIETFLKKKDFSNIPNEIELKNCLTQLLNQYKASNVTWTLTGYYKASVEGIV